MNTPEKRLAYIEEIESASLMSWIRRLWKRPKHPVLIEPLYSGEFSFQVNVSENVPIKDPPKNIRKAMALALDQLNTFLLGYKPDHVDESQLSVRMNKAGGLQEVKIVLKTDANLKKELGFSWPSLSKKVKPVLENEIFCADFDFLGRLSENETILDHKKNIILGVRSTLITLNTLLIGKTDTEVPSKESFGIDLKEMKKFPGIYRARVHTETDSYKEDADDELEEKESINYGEETKNGFRNPRIRMGRRR